MAAESSVSPPMGNGASAPPSVAGSSTSTPAKRACDACHRRKVKCVGAGFGREDCKHCLQAGLKCTFMKQPQKKGPKGSRAKVISELRETQRFDPPDSSSLRSLVASPRSSAPTSPMLPTGSINLAPELIDMCVEYFFNNVYPTQPILHRDALRHTISVMYQSPEAYVFIEALVAYMCIQPNMNLPPHLIPHPDIQSSTALGTLLMSDALEMRKKLNYFENATATTVTTSFFFFGCYFCLEKHNSAWFHLREATTLAVILGMHQEPSYIQGDPVANMLKRRLFWLLFVTERAYALQTQKPLTLHATINMPSADENSAEAMTLWGFIHLIDLFKPFDDNFVGLWNQSIERCNPDEIVRLQNQLADALPRALNSTETQAADLKTTQQWLRVMVWQLSISHRLLSSSARDPALTFRFPVDMARDMIAETSNFSQEAMEVHGIGLVSKMFDVACTLIDVMSCVPINGSSGFELGPRDYLDRIMQLMSKLRGGQERYLPLLVAKTNDALPALPNVPGARRRLPSSAGIFIEEIDNDPPGSASGTSTTIGSPSSGPIIPKSEYPDPMMQHHEQAPTSVPANFQYDPSQILPGAAGYLPPHTSFIG